MGQLGTYQMGQIRGFSDQISVHFGSMSQNVLKSDLKSPGFVSFDANLSHFEAKPDIPASMAFSLANK